MWSCSQMCGAYYQNGARLASCAQTCGSSDLCVGVELEQRAWTCATTSSPTMTPTTVFPTTSSPTTAPTSHCSMKIGNLESEMALLTAEVANLKTEMVNIVETLKNEL